MNPYSSSTRSALLSIELLEDRCVPSSAEFVDALYHDVLHRAPAPAEVESWTTVLNSGASPGQIALAFTTSLEYRSNVIRADYEIFLGRQPGSGEIAGWLAGMQAGLGEKQVEAIFLGSDEFFARHNRDNGAWLKGVYHDVLGRVADVGGLQSWIQKLQAGFARDTVALAIVDSPEADARLVTGAYHDLLKRNPDPAGLHDWVTALQRGLPPSGLLAAFAGSEEYIVLTAHGMLDVQTQPFFVPVAPEVFVADSFFVDPFVFDPSVFDSGAFDGGGCDCGGFDFGGFDSGGFDSGGGDGGDF